MSEVNYSLWVSGVLAGGKKAVWFENFLTPGKARWFSVEPTKVMDGNTAYLPREDTAIEITRVDGLLYGYNTTHDPNGVLHVDVEVHNRTNATVYFNIYKMEQP